MTKIGLFNFRKLKHLESGLNIKLEWLESGMNIEIFNHRKVKLYFQSVS